MPSYYSRIENYPHPIPADPASVFDPYEYSIWFERVERPPPFNKDVEVPRDDIETTLRALKRQFSDDLPIFRREYDAIHRAAVNGLGGTTNIVGGTNDLKHVKDTIIASARNEREAFILKTTRLAMWPLACGIVVFLLLFAPSKLLDQFIPGKDKTWTPDVFGYGEPFALLHVGVAIGVVFLAMINSSTPNLSQIALGFDQYGFSPRLRFIYVLVTAWILYLLMASDLVIIGVTKSFNDAMRMYPAFGIIIGLICAIADDAVVALIKLRTRGLLKSETGAR